jgi:hypothetical protein
MFRRTVSSSVLALVATLVLTAPVLAGGVVVTLDDTPSDVQKGEPLTVGFLIFSAHDGSPQAELEPTITATNPTTGQKVTLTAERKGVPGHYVAQLTLPSTGTWDWEIQPFGETGDWYPPSVMTPLHVGVAVVPAAEGAPASGVAAVLTPWLGMAVVGVATAAALIVAMRLRARVVARP